ncbi:MAG: hypothetical protein Q9170_004006 [Blastenia crenularia]
MLQAISQFSNLPNITAVSIKFKTTEPAEGEEDHDEDVVQEPGQRKMNLNVINKTYEYFSQEGQEMLALQRIIELSREEVDLAPVGVMIMDTRPYDVYAIFGEVGVGAIPEFQIPRRKGAWMRVPPEIVRFGGGLGGGLFYSWAIHHGLLPAAWPVNEPGNFAALPHGIFVEWIAE